MCVLECSDICIEDIFDTLSVLNGISQDSTIIRVFSGCQSTKINITGGKQMRVMWKANQSGNVGGFNCTFRKSKTIWVIFTIYIDVCFHKIVIEH